MAVNARKISADACNIVFNNLKGKTFVPEKTFVTQSATDNNISYLFTAIINNSDNSLLGGDARLSINPDSPLLFIFTPECRYPPNCCLSHQ